MPKWIDRALSFGPYVCLCTTEKDLKKALKKLGVNVSVEWVTQHGAVTHTYKKNDGSSVCCIVCIAKTKNKRRNAVSATLAHEATHVWQAWCEWVGEKNPGQEQEAYAIELITRNLLDAYYGKT